jgi:hypothetical protein
MNPKTDGCTLWIDGVWRSCCDAHDLAYANGMDYITSNLELGVCVAKTGHGIMGIIMTIGTMAFGWIFYKRIK